MNSLRSQISLILIAVVIFLLLVVGGLLVWRIYNVQEKQSVALEQEVAYRIGSLAHSFIEDRNDELRLMIQVHGLQAEQNQTLANLLSQDNVYTDLILFDSQGAVQAYQSRYELAADMTVLDELVQSDVFRIPLTTNETYYSPVRIETNTSEAVMTIGIPVVDLRTGQPSQVLVANFRLKSVWDQITSAKLRQNDTVYIVNNENRVVAHGNPSVVLRDTRFKVPSESGSHNGLSGTNVILATNTFEVGEQQFTVVAERPFGDAMKLARDTLIIIIVALLGTILAAVVIGFRASKWIVRPIEDLVATTRAIREGDFSRRAKTNRRDEIGTLAEAFNSMSAQLEETLQGLEARVQERTRYLSSVAAVAQRTATILDVPQLLQTVCDLTKEDFNLYHAHIYLLDEDGELLNLSAGAGDAGRTMVAGGHRIAMSHVNSLVALAARSRQVVVASDVSASPNFLPNPLLPKTRSELAIALISREQLLGVLDVQSENLNHFGPELITVVETLARQIAAALSNARLFTSLDVSARHDQTLGVITQQIQNAVNVDEVLQVAARELGKALRVPQTVVELRMK